MPPLLDCAFLALSHIECIVHIECIFHIMLPDLTIVCVQKYSLNNCFQSHRAMFTTHQSDDLHEAKLPP